VPSVKPKVRDARVGASARSRKSAPSVFKLSKIKYYLVDNIYCFMLSQLIGRVQEESERAGEGFPTGNSRTDGTWPFWATVVLSVTPDNVNDD
jgi:hypothetical protein